MLAGLVIISGGPESHLPETENVRNLFPKSVRSIKNPEGHIGWLYLAVVIDLYSRRGVGWALNRRMTTQLVIDALLMAIWRIKPVKYAMSHSDRGSRYCSYDFQGVVKLHGLSSSMSRKGDCWDNTAAESFFGTLKTEEEKTPQRPASGKTRPSVSILPLFHYTALLWRQSPARI